MEISTIIPHIEALIFASEKPLPTLDLVELVNNALGFIEDRASLDQVESAMEAIQEKYESEFYPFEVKQSGGGWQFLTKKEYHKTVAQLNGEKFLKKLSTAALETLSIIAYKQPVTKGEIENIRGVNCDYAVQKLLEKELIIITGRRENAPGQPLIYATSKSFMDYFGINTVNDLPKLQDIMSGENISATAVGNSNPVDEDIPLSDNNTLVVNESGDIEEVVSGENEELFGEALLEIESDLQEDATNDVISEQEEFVSAESEDTDAVQPPESEETSDLVESAPGDSSEELEPGEPGEEKNAGKQKREEEEPGEKDNDTTQ
ncbi:MAG: SMC-Scp complex subunit ScpB [Bacteroidota bacterium]